MGFDLARLRPRAHWTPRYIADRAALWWWTRRNPDAPWLVPAAVALLDQWLRSPDSVVEFGSGRSTLWFARRVARVVSIEHNPVWFATVSARLASAGVANVLLRLDPACASGGKPTDPATYLAPARDALAEAPSPPDLILIDGIHRDHAALWALERVRTPGGVIVLDNCERFIPGASRAPESIGPDARPPSPQWERFHERTKGLRRVRFSNGISDTMFFFT